MDEFGVGEYRRLMFLEILGLCIDDVPLSVLSRLVY